MHVRDGSMFCVFIMSFDFVFGAETKKIITGDLLCDRVVYDERGRQLHATNNVDGWLLCAQNHIEDKQVWR